MTKIFECANKECRLTLEKNEHGTYLFKLRRGVIDFYIPLGPVHIEELSKVLALEVFDIEDIRTSLIGDVHE